MSSACLLLFLSSGTPAHGMGSPTFRSSFSGNIVIDTPEVCFHVNSKSSLASNDSYTSRVQFTSAGVKASVSLWGDSAKLVISFLIGSSTYACPACSLSAIPDTCLVS